MNSAKIYRSRIRSQVLSAWRTLLHYAVKPLALGKKLFRRKSSGEVGLHSSFVIHSGPASSAETIADEQVKALLLESERRFRAGTFFEPMAQHTDEAHAVITGRLQQGEGEAQVDSIFAVFPRSGYCDPSH
jgi:hypothetical protein